MMKSRIVENKHVDIVKLCRQMTPEERLVAFLNHSQFIARIHHAGAQFRERSRAPRRQQHT